MVSKNLFDIYFIKYINFIKENKGSTIQSSKILSFKKEFTFFN